MRILCWCESAELHRCQWNAASLYMLITWPLTQQGFPRVVCFDSLEFFNPHMDNIYMCITCAQMFWSPDRPGAGRISLWECYSLKGHTSYSFSHSQWQIQQPNFAQEHAINRGKEGKPFCWMRVPTWHRHCNEPAIDLCVIILLSFTTTSSSVVVAVFYLTSLQL